MKMVEVYNANGDKILACACDLEYYQNIGWKTEAAAKPRKGEATIERTKEAE